MSRNPQSNRVAILWELKSRFPIFSEKYPSVASCTIKYNRTIDSPGGHLSDPQEQVKYINMSESSFVTIECYNTDCRKGYFELHGIIDEMVSHHETFRKGEMLCDGYLEEYSANQCLCLLVYKISIEYI